MGGGGGKDKKVTTEIISYIKAQTLRVVHPPKPFYFKNNVGKRRIRPRTSLNLNGVIFDRFEVNLEIHRSIAASLYVGSDIDFKNAFRH